MKKIFVAYTLLLGTILLSSCSKTESDFSAAETISLSSNTVNIVVGSPVSFTAISSKNSANITTSAQIFVNGTLVTTNPYIFEKAGTYAVYATSGGITSNIVTVTVVEKPLAGYTHHPLIEEFTGTWCGDCPTILYGSELLNKQTQSVIEVSVHVNSADPFNTPQCDTLEFLHKISWVPTGEINGTKIWTAPQYENVNEVIKEIKPYANAGLAISTTVSGGSIQVAVQFAYKEALAGNASLFVEIVEDSLKYTQRNYSSNLYGGQPNIPNFTYHGVLRHVITALVGEKVANSGINNQKNYTLAIPTNIVKMSNAKIVAFIKDANGLVINAQQAKVGATQAFEKQ